MMKSLSKLLLLFFCLSAYFSQAALTKSQKKDSPPPPKADKLHAPGCAASYIQTGSVFYGYAGTGDSFESGSGPRTHYYWVPFDSIYCLIPKVHVSITGFDTANNANQRLIVSIYNIFTNGFNLKVDTWMDSKIYSVKVDFIAINAT